MESSRRDLFIDMVVDKVYIAKIRFSLVSFTNPKQVWDCLKQRLVFTVCMLLLLISTVVTRNEPCIIY